MPPSEAFKTALRNSHTAISKVTLRRGTQVLVDDLTVLSGEVTDDAAAQVRRRCALTLPGIASVMALLPQAQPATGGLWPLGNELVLKSGIRYPAKFAGSYKTYNNYLSLTGASGPHSFASSARANATSGVALRGLVMAGTAGHAVGTSNHASLNVTGDLDLRAYVVLADWTPAATVLLMDKVNPFDTTAGGYRLGINTSGIPFLLWSNGSGAFIQKPATAAVPTSDGFPKWVRATLDLDNGAGGYTVEFYTSDDGVTWVPLGNPVITAGAMTLVASTQSLMFGTDIFGNNGTAGLILKRNQVYNGIAGTKVFDVNFTDTSQGWTNGETAGGTGVDATGKTVSIGAGATSLFIRSVLNIPGDLDIRLIDLVMTDWTPAAAQDPASHWNDILENQRGWLLQITSTGNLVLYWSNDGTAVLNATSTATLGSVGATDGNPLSIRATLDVVNGANKTVTFYYSTNSGITWTILGAAVTTAGNTSVFLSTREICLGARNIGSTDKMVGRITRFELRDGIDGPIVASTDTRPLAAGTTSWTDAQGNSWTTTSNAPIVESVTTTTVGTDTPQTDELISMGVFRISKPVINDSGADLTISVEGFDRSRSVSRAGFTQPYNIALGTNYSDAIKTLIQAKAPWLQASEFSFMTTPYETPQLVFTESEDPWTMATQMAASIGAELFFNGDGVCVLQPQPDPQYTPSSFDYVEGEDATLTGIGRDLDDQEAYNGVVIISENSDLVVPIRAEKWDTNPLSPTYYDPALPAASIYGPVPKIVTSQYITTQDQADAAAAAEFTRLTGIIEKIDFSGVNNPAHFAGDVIKVKRSRVNVDNLYVLESIRMGLGATASMSGTTRRRRAA